MKNTHTPPSELPLDELLNRLAAVGFRISPADRARALDVIGLLGAGYLQMPEKLKFLLAPILARNKEEQALFYSIFDQYYREITQPQDISPIKIARRTSRFFFPGFIPAVISVILAGVGYLGYIRWNKPVETLDAIDFMVTPNDYPRIGDTLYLNNFTTSADEKRFEYSWKIRNAAFPKPVVPPTDIRGNAVWVANVPPNNRVVSVSLFRHDKTTGKLDSLEKPLALFCDALPSNQLYIEKKNDTLRVKSLMSVQSGFTLRWRFASGTTLLGNPIVITPKDYSASWVKATLLFSCHGIADSVEFRKQLTTTGLAPSEGFSDIDSFKWYHYVLLAILLAAVVFLSLVIVRQIRIRRAKKELENKPETIVFSDKAPYEIPFPDPESWYESPQVLHQLVKALYLRTESERSTIDIDHSIRSTLDSWGYLQLKFRAAYRKDEFLFLVDEQNIIQAKIYKYITDELAKQDINIEVYYHNAQLNRFWNKEHVQGIDLDQLQRKYASSVLVVFGNMYELLDPFPEHLPCLRASMLNKLLLWKSRFLLTPQLPVAWTYREQLLFEQFILLPCDEEGLSAFAACIENGKNREDMATSFDVWQKEQSAKRPKDVSCLYRRWDSADDIADYLALHPDLFKLVCAVFIYPKFNWYLFVLLAQTLDVRLNFTKLLILSGIPALSRGSFDPFLQQELLAHLYYEEEILVRKALKEALQNLEDKIPVDSFAHIEYRINSSIQRFAIHPMMPQNQADIEQLYFSKMLNNKNRIYLNGVVSRFNKRSRKQFSKSEFRKLATSDAFEAFLKRQHDEELKNKKRQAIHIKLRKAAALLMGLFVTACLVYAYKPSWFIELFREDKILPIFGVYDVSSTGDTLYPRISDFTFVDQEGANITNDSLKDKLYVMDVFHITCPNVSPKVKKNELRIYNKYRDEPRVVLMSFSIDVKHDTVPELKRYAQSLGIPDNRRWHILTGDHDAIFGIMDDHLQVATESTDAPFGFDHSGRLILVDHKRHIRSFCDGTDWQEVERFIQDIDALLKEMDKQKK